MLYDISRVLPLLDKASSTGVSASKLIAEDLMDFFSKSNLRSSQKDLADFIRSLLQAQRDNGDDGLVNFPLGLVAIVGPGSAGKTTYLRGLEKYVTNHASNGWLASHRMIHMGEMGALYSYSLRVVVNLLQSYDVLFIDSLKDIWNDPMLSRGSITPGGVYVELQQFLSVFSLACAYAGKTVVAVMNPQMLSGRGEVYAMITSQTAGMIQLKEFGSAPAYDQVKRIPIEDDSEVDSLFVDSSGVSISPSVVFDKGMPVERETFNFPYSYAAGEAENKNLDAYDFLGSTGGIGMSLVQNGQAILETAETVNM